MTTDTLMQQLLDEAAIRGVVDGISRTVDAKDWDDCRAFFGATVDVDFTSLAGGAPAQLAADDLVYRGWAVNLYAEKHSHHMHTGHQIVIDGDTATCFTKGYAWNRLARQNGGNLWEVWDNYLHTLRRTDQGWLCTGMIFTVTHAQGNETVRDFIPTSNE